VLRTPGLPRPLKSIYSKGIYSEGIHSEGIHSEGIQSEGIHSEGIHSEDKYKRFLESDFYSVVDSKGLSDR
jgi:hypothetical protein